MDIFYIRLILSFILGAAWITSATVLAEKFGSKIGGVITGIPSTAVLSLFFIGLTQSPEFAVQSSVVVPAIMGVCALFCAIYILLSKQKLLLSLALPLITWFVLSFLMVIFKLNSLATSLVIFTILYTLAIFLVAKYANILSVTGKKMSYSFGQISFRAILSGTIIAGAVLASKFGGPILGGVFASFPAIMLSTMIITYLTQGRNFSNSIIKIVMISGSFNVVVYVLAVRLTYPLLSLYLGTLTSFLISVFSSYLTYRFINKRLS
jgi:hypothetical protein